MNAIVIDAADRSTCHRASPRGRKPAPQSRTCGSRENENLLGVARKIAPPGFEEITARGKKGIWPRGVLDDVTGRDDVEGVWRERGLLARTAHEAYRRRARLRQALPGEDAPAHGSVSREDLGSPVAGDEGQSPGSAADLEETISGTETSTQFLLESGNVGG